MPWWFFLRRQLWQLFAAMMSWVGQWVELVVYYRIQCYQNVRRMGITEILRRIWLFSANKIKISESVSKQPTQLIVQLNSSLRHIIVTFITSPKSSTVPAIVLSYDFSIVIIVDNILLRGFVIYPVYVFPTFLIIHNLKL